MKIFKKGDFICIVDRVKNSTSGNPRYEIIPIWCNNPTNNPINMTYDLSFFGYRVKKDFSYIIVSTYNLDDALNKIFTDCHIKALIIKGHLNKEEIDELEKFARLSVITDSETLEIYKRLSDYTPIEVMYKKRVYTVYLKE